MKILAVLWFSTFHLFRPSEFSRVLIYLARAERHRTAAPTKNTIGFGRARNGTFLHSDILFLDLPNCIVFFVDAASSATSQEAKSISTRVRAHTQKQTRVLNPKAGRHFTRKKKQLQKVPEIDFCARRTRHLSQLPYTSRPIYFRNALGVQKSVFRTPLPKITESYKQGRFTNFAIFKKQ